MSKHTRIWAQLRTATVVFLLATFFGGCATIKTGSHQDDSASFGQYQTFAWIADDPLILGDDEQPPLSPLSRKKIVDAIKSELSSQGFRYVANPERADLVVSYTIGTREKIDALSYPSGYQGTWGWHIYGRNYYLNTVEHRSYTEGTLGVDIFDGKTKEPIWHGWATKTILTSDRENPSPSIKKAVAGIIARFPPSIK